MPGWTLIPAQSLIPTTWRNGRGTSRDLFTHHGPDAELLWQVSIADLVQDGPFSHYRGMDRIFTPIAGDPPPQLAFHGGPFEPCPLLVPKPFAGDWPTLSRVPAPGQAFNVIFDRNAYRATVTVQTLPADAEIELPESPDLLLHCLTGAVILDAGALQPGDSAVGLLDASRAVMAQPGITLVVGIWPL